MKYLKLIFLALIIIGFSNSLKAGIWRVNNNPGIDADFNNLQTAVNDANVVAGDTLLIEGSSLSYGSSISISKKLILLGTGYFLSENPETQANPANAYAGQVSINSGAEGSVISGLTLNTININTSNTVIMRCRIISYIILYNNASNVTIIQNYFENDPNYNIYLYTSSSNVLIVNNIFNKVNGVSINSTTTATAIVQNNVFSGASTIRLYNSVFANNILNGNSIDFTGCSVLNNLCNATQLPTGNGNQLNINMNTVFVGSGSTDGQWQLKTGSPAIGAGTNGEDCGAFGGTSIYILSGLPQIPAIYFYSAPVSGSALQGLPVHIKILSHN